MATDISSVVNHFPSAENGFSTTTSGSVSSGAASVGLNSVAGYANGEVVVFVVDPDDAAKKQTFTGIIDTAGVQVTNVVWTAGTNQSHAAGATVVDYATATHISMMTKGILVHADQDGTLKAGAVDGAAVLASNVVTTAKIADANVTTAKIADEAVTSEKLDATIAFRAWDSGGTTLTDGSIVQVNLATEVYDLGSDFASSAFTAPIAGVYHFDGMFTISGAVASGVSQLAFIYVDGVVNAIGARTTAINDGGSSVSADIQLAAGAVVTFRAFQDSAGNEATDTNSSRTWFSGHFIGA